MKERIIDIFKDTLLDSVKIIPFLFVAFLIVEIIEHKLEKKSKKIISTSGKVGPLFGSFLGLLPQCGFSVLATNLYITRIISLGSLIAVYLSTSDEMLPILISEKAAPKTILSILLIKFIVGLIIGFLIDLIIRKKHPHEGVHIHDLCEDENCHCEEDGIIKSSVRHTLRTIIFILIITLILNTIMEFVGNEYLSKFLSKGKYLSPFISSLVGLIPNCGASIIITELYLKGVLNFGACIAGLLTGCGVGLLVLFKSNKNLKENIGITLTIYSVGVIVGIIIELIAKFI